MMSKWVIFISRKDHYDLFLKNIIQIYNASLDIDFWYTATTKNGSYLIYNASLNTDSWYTATTKNGNHLSISGDKHSKQTILEIIEFSPDSFLVKNIDDYFTANIQYFNMNGLVEFCYDFSDFPDGHICDNDDLFTVKQYHAILTRDTPKKEIN